MNTKIGPVFVNLCVADLARSVKFFSDLGLSFDPRFTNDQAACLILNEHAYVMLLPEAFFKTFTKQDVCDTSKHTEMLLALMLEERAGVDALVNKALASGGSAAMPAQDMGFMYSWSFYDPDRHHWEVGWMDPNARPPAAT
ncbi:MAG: glyoxalase/bleomycin resistance/extradiol dioxygenase family protein [Polyangiaceae bacterium]|nr:glyoxalase/bleomycin resistance/extradiol dioxygenase family protein [Polyangiaceae bacterium]